MKHFGFNLAARGAGNTVQSVVEAETMREGIVLAEAEHPGMLVIRGSELLPHEVDKAIDYAETNHR